MNRVNVPDEIWLGKKEYSIWRDFKVNGWLFAAALFSGATEILFPHVVRSWPIGIRTMVTLAPFVALLFWTRNLARWIRGMDELHRRITVSAILFATTMTFFFVTIWHRLDRVGLFQSIFDGTAQSPRTSWDINTLPHIFLLLTVSYFFGYRWANRRYQ